MTKESKQNFTVVLMIIAVSLLTLILFKDNIKAYYKAKEVLKRVDVFNIPDVIVTCYGDIQSSDNDGIPSKECMDILDEYSATTTKWDDLIKRNGDINCQNFSNGKEAKNFYHYVSGELAAGWEAYQSVRPGKWKQGENFGFGLTNKFDGKCRYDPYGLDTNSDCNACEGY